MKKILVPTDFSPAANNAARYAMHIAEKIKADIILCNAVLPVMEAPVAGQIAWSLEGYGSVKTAADEDLNALASKLRAHGRECIPPHDFHPEIAISSVAGTFVEAISDVFEESKATMTIMGMSGAGNVSRFFLGSNSKVLIEEASFPMILVPAHHTFGNIEKIAFATDLSAGDIQVIYSLAAFARYFNAEILIAHVTDGLYDEKTEEKKVEQFLSSISDQANYPKIYYRHVVNLDTSDGLSWLSEHGRIDLLTMVHRKHNFWHRMFIGSHTQDVAREVAVPLMVYPEGCHPNF